MAGEKRSHSQQAQTCYQKTMNPLAMFMTANFILHLCQTFHLTLLVIFKEFHIQKFLVTQISYQKNLIPPSPQLHNISLPKKVPIPLPYGLRPV